MSPDLRTHTFASMGGSTEVQVVGAAAADPGRVETLFDAHEQVMSRFALDSELCALNSAATSPFPASPLLFDAVSEAVGWACITGGVFDPTVIDALEATGYDRRFDEIDGRTIVVPKRTRPLAPGRWRQILLDYEREMITLPWGTRIDLGGIGKGYTVDRAIAALGAGANAMVNASGDLYAAGDGPDGDGWYVGVADPLNPDRDLLVLNVNDRGVATSGASKRRWSDGDARYHHLIDSRTRRCSDSDLLSVTVVALTATQADVLAKTAFLLGSDDGLRMIERFDGVECFAVVRDGEALASSGMAEYFA